MSTPAKVTPPTKKGPLIPEGYHTVAPHLCVDGAAQALEFYQKALGAIEVKCLRIPGGRIGHAEIQIATALEYGIKLAVDTELRH
jgi:uncharacterized glyoxalase superfamily protein PhnB